MKVHEYRCELWLSAAKDRVFSFFADAANLDAITPPWLNFEILTPMPLALHKGALIDYRLRVRGVPFRWKTRINKWSPPDVFVDEQIQGPYRLWIHEHTFQARDTGTLVRDHVRYATPLDTLLHRWVVRP